MKARPHNIDEKEVTVKRAVDKESPELSSCHLCEFSTLELKPSKAKQRLRSHHSSHHVEPAPPSSPCQQDATPAPTSSPSMEELSQSVHPFSAHEEDPQPTSPLPPHQEARSQPANPSAQQGDAPKPDASSCPDTVVNEGEQYIYSGHHL